MEIGLRQPKVRYLVETVTMVVLIVVAYFSITTIEALPRVDESLTRSSSVRKRVPPKPADLAKSSAAAASQRVAASVVMTGFVAPCAAREPACDIRLADVALADARPEGVRALLASLASNRCKDGEYRSFADNGYGQFHRLYSSDDRYLGVIFVDRDVCSRSPLAPTDAAIWPAPGVAVAHVLQAQGPADRKASGAGGPDRAGSALAGAERTRLEPGMSPQARSIWEEPRAPRCVAKPVMTDDELARCRTN
jgi:hypothetical protein